MIQFLKYIMQLVLFNFLYNFRIFYSIIDCSIQTAVKQLSGHLTEVNNLTQNQKEANNLSRVISQ